MCNRIFSKTGKNYNDLCYSATSFLAMPKGHRESLIVSQLAHSFKNF